MNQILYGKPVADQIERDIKEYLDILPNDTNKPLLAIVRVGNDPASEAYIRSKIKACERVGILSKVIELQSDITQDGLLKTVDTLNNDKDVTGILVQLPLPKHINENIVANSIAVHKDVDCFTDVNLGKFYSGNYKIAPCTPLGVIKLLDYYGFNMAGKKVGIVGRSLIAGKPMAEMILQRNGMPVIIHSKIATSDQLNELRTCDIIISATGRPKSLTFIDLATPYEWVKAKACVDIGITRVDGKLQGDFDKDSLLDYTSITPVPGGTGLTTVASLLLNTIECYMMQN